MSLGRPHTNASPAAAQRARISAVTVAVALLLAACSPTATPPDTTTAPVATPGFPREVDGSGFDDHTVSELRTTSDFFALARDGVAGRSVVKFVITSFSSAPRVRWYDSNFYTLHDEWFWFRLLNGAAVPGSGLQPVAGIYQTVADIYEWAARQDSLPLGLEFVGSQAVGTRLYSGEFYDEALREADREFGLGSLIHFPDSPGGAGPRWVIELEFGDLPSVDELAVFFDTLRDGAPPEIGNNLEWVPRSPAQETLAAQVESQGGPRGVEIVRYSELTTPGTVEVYNPGITAGRLVIIGPGGSELNEAREDDILLMETAPDWLPPGRALITEAPQTPLAHVNLLARNRGIPNASQSGLLQDPGIRQAARVRAHAVVRAAPDGSLDLVLITPQEYRSWVSTVEPQGVVIEPAPVDGLDTVVDVAALAGTDDFDAWVSRIGGKAAGLIRLIEANATTPYRPLAITVAPYRRHVEPLAPAIAAMVESEAFQQDPRARFLMLEGPNAYADFYPSTGDLDYARGIVEQHPPGSLLGDLITAGGLQKVITSRPIDSDDLGAIVASLERTFADLALSQGLRFRSSSTVEDVPGFNGAGLYDSNTGYFRPDVQLDDGDHHKTVEWAIKRTWASFWSFEAHEERRRAKITGGEMAILVHPRFDDDKEVANGVMTFTFHREGPPELVINAQAGPISVANPDPELGARPEIVRVIGDDMEIQRVASSNQVGAGKQVLADPAVMILFSQAKAASEHWRDQVNASLPAAQQIVSLTLDFEFKDMAAGWPTMEGGIAESPPQLILKQVRPLEPGDRDLGPDLADLPVPRDVLVRARLIERVECGEGESAVTSIEVFTDPLVSPDVGFADDPFTAVLNGEAPAEGPCTRTTLYANASETLVGLIRAEP